MGRSIFPLLGATVLLAGAAFYAETHAEASAPSAAVGALICNTVEGADGTTQPLDCLFARGDGSTESYRAAIKRSGAAALSARTPFVWQVFASGAVESGALAGDYDRASTAKSPRLVEDGHRRISLEPMRVKGAAGLNVAAGVAEVTLQSGS